MEGGYCDAGAPNPPCNGTGPADGEIMFSRSRHINGVNVALADGSVRFVSNSVTRATWQALGTAEANDPVGHY